MAKKKAKKAGKKRKPNAAFMKANMSTSFVSWSQVMQGISPSASNFGITKIATRIAPTARCRTPGGITTHIPGFTAISMYPRLWGLSGLPSPDLLDELVRLAFERHERKTRMGVGG